MASIISQAYLNDQDDLPAILPIEILPESFRREQLTSYEVYTITPTRDSEGKYSEDSKDSNKGKDEIRQEGLVGRKRNDWATVHINKGLCSQDEIIENIRKLDASRRSIVIKKDLLSSNQRKQITNIVDSKTMDDHEGQFNWDLVQLQCEEFTIPKTRRKETTSITIYLKRVPKPGVDVFNLYETDILMQENQKLKMKSRQQEIRAQQLKMENRQMEMQKRQNMGGGQYMNQEIKDIFVVDKLTVPITSSHNVVPYKYDSQESIESMPLASLYYSDQQDQRNTLVSRYWSVAEQKSFPMLVGYYGTDWHGIAKSMATKTHVMAKNYYQRQVNSGRSDLKEMARIADERRKRGESAAPLPPKSMSLAELQFQVTTQQQQSQNPQQTRPQQTQQQQPSMNNRDLREITLHEQAMLSEMTHSLMDAASDEDKNNILINIDKTILLRYQNLGIDPIHLHYRDQAAKHIRQEKQRQMPRIVDLRFIGGLDSQHQNENISSMDRVVLEGPCTDSGYASILKANISRNDPALPGEQQCPINDIYSVKMGDEDKEDAGTLYSAATSIDLPHSQQYIAELCSDIFSKLENHFDSTNWNTLEKALPSLIKAFAIKIGYDSSAQVNQDIMYFIHKQHSGIISHLKTMFCREDDGQPTSSQRGPKGMSLLDKMSMWDNKAGEIDTVAENNELFEGVGDDDDEITNEVGLSKYHGVIIQSPSYEWLLSSLRNEFSLQWGSKQPRIMVENISQKILDKLPTGTISKRRPINACEVIFELKWDGVDVEDGLCAKLMTSEIVLSELITVTGCREESQALTIEQYLRQTWPANGLQLLSVLQRVITNYDQYCSVVLPDNTQLNARIRGSHLTVTGIGPAQFIAECAEQLAWLQTALLCNSLNLAGHCVPLIENYVVDTTHSRSKQLKYRGRCEIAVGLTPLANPTDAILQKQSWLQDLVRKGTVQGFPIARRPEAYPGLELSFELLLSSVQTNGAIIDGGLVLLKGPISTLQLLKDTNDVFLWQPFHTRNGICSCGEHHMEIRLNIPYSSFDLRRLKSGRHILGVCKDLLTTITENSDGMCTKSSLPEAKYVQHHTLGNPQNTAYNLNAGNPNEILSGPPEFYDDEQNSTSSISSSVDCSKAGLSFYTGSLKGHLLSNDQTQLIADSPSNSTMPSQDESLDSDMLSISDASEQFEFPENNVAINAFIIDVVNNLLSGFRCTTQCQFSQAAGGNGGQSMSTIRLAETGSSTTSGNSGRSRKKRRAADDDDDDADQDNFRKRPNKKPRLDPKKGPQKSFACPYLKKDPVRHGNCCANQLSRIRDVKQHLSRVHTLDRFCQRCGETDFRSDEALDEHLDLNSCPRNRSRTLGGISIKQQKELSRKSKTGIGEEEQWFKIWEILFYTRPRPSSVYMDTELSVQLRLFKEYCDTRESDVVVGLYEADPIWSAESTEEQRRAFVQMVFAQGVNRVFEDYRLSLRSREQGGDGAQPTQSEAPLSSFADSGIVVGSQASPQDVNYRRHIPSQPPPRFGNGEPSSRRHILSQSSLRDVSSRGHTPSQAPPIFNNGGPSVWMSQDENFRRQIPSQPPPQKYISSRRHIPSQPPARFDNGEPTASIPNDGRSRRQIPSQAPPTFNNRESGVWMAQHGSSQGQIPSQARPVLDNGGPSVWMQQEGMVQMTQRLENDPLDLSNYFFDFERFGDSRLDLELSNQP